jgi:hypothetical protein
MTDQNLLVFGFVVMFIAFAGAYVFIKESFEDVSSDAPSEIERPSVRVPSDESS